MASIPFPSYGNGPPFSGKKKIRPLSCQNCEALLKHLLLLTWLVRLELAWVRVRVKTLKTVLLGDVTDPISPTYKYIKTNCSIKETIPFYSIRPFAFDNI